MSRVPHTLWGLLEHGPRAPYPGLPCHPPGRPEGDPRGLHTCTTWGVQRTKTNAPVSWRDHRHKTADRAQGAPALGREALGVAFNDRILFNARFACQPGQPNGRFSMCLLPERPGHISVLAREVGRPDAPFPIQRDEILQITRKRLHLFNVISLVTGVQYVLECKTYSGDMTGSLNEFPWTRWLKSRGFLHA
jgi:hypothetical protein